MERFKWAAQAIAQPYEVQKRLFPDFVNVADELALEWDASLEECKPLLKLYQTASQKAAVESLDNYMLSISGLDNLQYWNDQALCHSAEWGNMRKLATELLNAMGWEHEIPAIRSDRIYVGKP